MDELINKSILDFLQTMLVTEDSGEPITLFDANILIPDFNPNRTTKQEQEYNKGDGKRWSGYVGNPGSAYQGRTFHELMGLARSFMFDLQELVYPEEDYADDSFEDEN